VTSLEEAIVEFKQKEYLAVQYKNHSKFHWSFVGFETLKEAETERDNIISFVEKTLGKDWTISSSAGQTPVGYKAEVHAELTGGVNEKV
jgi:hypothetical protein